MNDFEMLENCDGLSIVIDRGDEEMVERAEGIAHANRLPPDTSPICSAKPPISRPSIAHATP